MLIDYRDIRNYVFYGSANTEIAYNINYIVNNYPYNTLIGQPFGTNFIQTNNYIDIIPANSIITINSGSTTSGVVINLLVNSNIIATYTTVGIDSINTIAEGLINNIPITNYTIDGDLFSGIKYFTCKN